MNDLAVPKVEPAKLDDEDIHYVVRAELQNLTGDDYDELAANQEAAYRYYKVDPRPGDENLVGRTKIQSSDVSDAIEWLKPTIIKAFVESPDVVRFDPVNPSDQAQADAESDYVHHVFMKQCNGLLVLLEAISDALLVKNCVTYTYWCEEKRQRVQRFEQYTQDELQMLLNPLDGSTARLEDLSQDMVPVQDPQTGMPMMGQDGQPMMQPVFDGTVRFTQDRGKAKVEVCVPERFFVRSDHGSIDLREARAAFYKMEKPVSDLVIAGYDMEKIRDCPTSESSDDNEVLDARRDVENDTAIGESAIEAKDFSQRMVTVWRCFCRLDVNGDGVEELYVVVLGGDDGEVLLDYYEVDECPFNAGSPFIAAHKFWGYSLYDKLKEIQDLKTKFLRMVGDNIEFTNNPEKKVNPGLMRIEDAMVRRVGGIKRVDDMSAYEELPVPLISPLAYSVLEWADKMRAERVGIDPNAQSISKIFPDEAMNTAVERLMTAKEEVVGLIIRSMAEVWFAPLMLRLRTLLMTHLKREEMLQIYGKWVRIDPRNWIERSATTVKVGLGTGDRIKKMMALEKVMGFQGQEALNGMGGITVTASQRVHSYSEFIRAAGLGDPDQFWLNPVKTEMEIQQMGGNLQAAPSIEAAEAFMERQRTAQMMQSKQQPPQGPTGPDPQTLMQIEQMKGQTTLQAKQMDLQARREEKQMDLAAKQQEGQIQAQLEMAMKRMEAMQEQMQFVAENTRKWAELFQKDEVAQEELVTKAIEARAKVKAAAAKPSSGGGDK